MKKKKLVVAIVSPEFPPHTNWGGIATFNYNLSLLLTDLGHSVSVITYKDGISSLEKDVIIHKQSKIVVYYIPLTANRAINFLYYRLFGIIRYFMKKWIPRTSFIIDWNFFSLWYFSKTLHGSNIDIIHSPTYGAPSLLIKITHPNIPCVLHLHGPQYLVNSFEKKSIDNSIFAFFENIFACAISDKIIACSQDLHEKFVRKFPKIQDKTLYIHNFLSETVRALSKKRNVHVNANNLVFWGRLEYRKGVDILLQTFLRLASNDESLKLFLIGEDSNTFLKEGKWITTHDLLSQSEASQAIKERVFFIPNISRKNSLTLLLKLIRGIAVFPARYEPLGFTTLEALDLGFITIASKRGGGKEIIEDSKNGFLVQPTIKNLEKQILKAQKKSRHVLSMLPPKFSFETAKINYSDLYNEIFSEIN